MKRIFACLSMVLILVIQESNANEDKPYELELSISDEYKYLAYLKYTNKTNNPHCIRADDLEFRVLGDFLRIENESGERLRYIGDKGSYKEIMFPEAYKIVLPGASTVAPFYINDFYKISGKNISISYAFPVIDCDVVLSRHIKLPPPESIKKIDERYDVAENFKDGYPDWYKEGFLAISNTLQFRKK